VTPFAKGKEITGGGLLEVGGGDVVAFRYSRPADGEVPLLRLNVASGKVVWRACWASPGVVRPSDPHDVTVAVAGEQLYVYSQRPYGTVLGVFDLRTGKQFKQTRLQRV
jgi:hypothetical protein